MQREFLHRRVAFSLLSCYNRNMDKKKEPQEAKRFQYKLTKTMILLALAVILLCGVGIGISVYRVITFGIHDFTDTLQSPFLIAVCLFCIAIVVSILIKSQYVVSPTHYVIQFGFIKSKFLIKEITSLELNTTTNKLTVYVGEQFSVLSVNESWRDEFIAAIREVKPEIDFTFTLADNVEEK